MNSEASKLSLKCHLSFVHFFARQVCILFGGFVHGAKLQLPSLFHLSPLTPSQEAIK